MKTYVITYNDGMYITLDLELDDYCGLTECLVRGDAVAVLSVGVLAIKDIRYVVERKEAVENEAYLPELSEEEKRVIQEQQWLAKYQQELGEDEDE